MVMMNYDEIPNDAGLLPEGTYPMRVMRVDDSKLTNSGDPMWSLELEVIDGVCTGRRVYDRLIFSQAGAKRVKFIVGRLGLPTQGAVELLPHHLVGRCAMVTVAHETYAGKPRCVVPYSGYDFLRGYDMPQAPQQHPQPAPEDELPF